MLLALLFSGNVKAQIGRSDWSCGVIVQTDNFVYSALGKAITYLPAAIAVAGENQARMDKVGNFYYDNLWWIPDFRYRANVVQDMEFAAGKATVYPKAWGFSDLDWGLKTYSVGYHVGYLSRIFPLGFDVQVDYAQDGFKIRMDGSSDKNAIVKRMLSGTALLKIRLLAYDAHRINPVIEIGGGYNYALHYHDDVINDKDAVNNGFVGVVGLGFTNTETHVSWSLRYEHAFYDFYNEDFLYQGTPVFEGAKSTFGRLGVAVTIGF